MKHSIFLLIFVLRILVIGTSSISPNAPEEFVECLLHYFPNSTSISKIIYTPNNHLYHPILDFSIQNLRFASAETPKPQVIVTPLEPSHVQAVIYCAGKHDLQVRVRTGGHDFEGLSYVGDGQFVILDMFNLQNITIDVKSATAWVQAGATLGELYYAIASKTNLLGFPGGECPTVGVSGFLSGGGFGRLARKYGLGADNVIDAHFIDVHGRIHDRRSMSEDLFWAIRGGGGGNFGVIIAWKLNLVPVPPRVTVFTIIKDLEPSTKELVYKWQNVAHTLPKEIFLRLHFKNVEPKQGCRSTVQISFQCLFLGRTDQLLLLLDKPFPELGVVREDCKEMTWIESILYFENLTSIHDLLTRADLGDRTYFKRKSDYVREPIPVRVLERLWELISEEDPGVVTVGCDPSGGRMSEFSESALPYPHRGGVLYHALSSVSWHDKGPTAAFKHLSWMNESYGYLAPYVSKNPREAYVNFRDLDFGVTSKYTTFEEARIWGVKYFKDNFDRLGLVKAKVDPRNFFRDQQSIPPRTDLDNSALHPYNYRVTDWAPHVSTPKCGDYDS